MLTITEILDGNIYRVVEENDLSQTGDLTDSSEVTFDNVYNYLVEFENSSDESVTGNASEADVSQDGETDLDAIFASASSNTGVDANLLKAVAQAESGFDTEAVSSCGAMGIMQLMPSTCSSYGVSDPFDAAQNVNAGAEVLSDLLERYGWNLTLSLAAYNAGSGNVDKYGGVPPFAETTAFIDKVMNLYDSYSEESSSQVSDNLYSAYASGYNRFL
jgi:soluble lytic murein transglycosylase-like protein